MRVPLLRCLRPGGTGWGPNLPPSVTLQSWIQSLFFLGLFPLADFRTRNVKHCCVIIPPPYLSFPPIYRLYTFYELQIMQASFVLSLKVDLIAAPNYEIYQFYQSLIKIKNASPRFTFCLSGLLGCTSNVF